MAIADDVHVANGDVRMERVYITLDLAQELLDRPTPRQRRIMPSHQRVLADEMRAERWQETAAPIQLARDGGWVLDGRHRLSAIVETGRAQWGWVAYNCDPTTFDVIDAIRPRTAANVLEAEGAKNSRDLEAVVRLIHSWSRGAAEFKALPTRSRVLDLARTYDDQLQPLFQLGAKASKQTRVEVQGSGGRTKTAMPKSMATFCAFLDDGGSDGVIGRLADWPDEEVYNHSADAVALLRTGLTAPTAKGRDLSKRAVVSLFIKAKNLDHTGTASTAKGLTYRSSEALPMPEWPVPLAWGADRRDGDEDE